MKRSAPITTPVLRVHLTRGRQSVLPRHGDKGVQDGVVRLDSFKTGFRQLDSGDGLPPKEVGRFLQGEISQIFLKLRHMSVCLYKFLMICL